MQEVVLDTNALIDLMNLSCWEALADLPGFRFWIVENVREEVTREDQRKALEGAEGRRSKGLSPPG